MDKESLELIAKAASEAAQKATNEAIVKVGQDFGELKKEHEQTAAELVALKKQIADGDVKVAKMNGTLVKVANNIKGISLADCGIEGADAELNKAKLYRGIATGRWEGSEKELAVMTTFREKSQLAGVATDGGYAIPPEYATSIIELIRKRNPFESLNVMRLNLSRYHFKMPKITTGASAYWVGEAAAITETDVKFGMLTLEPRKVANIVYASKEMVNAADAAIVATIENDMARAIVDKMVVGFLYGNGVDNMPLGLANTIGIKSFDPSADTNGTDPTKANFRRMRMSVSQDLVSDSFAFLGNELAFAKAAELVSSTAPEAAALQADEVLIRNACGKPYVATGHVAANKTKGSGVNLSDMFYGAWEDFVMATWWGGLTLESTTVGGDAFKNDCYAFKAVLPTACAARRADAFVHGKFISTIKLD